MYYFPEPDNNNENIVATLKKIIEDNGWHDDESIIKNINVRYLVKMGIWHIVYKHYGSLFAAIDDIYPNRFVPWQFERVPKNFWTKDTACLALQNIIHNMGIPKEEIPNYAKTTFLYKIGLSAVVNKLYKKRVKALYFFKDAFPEIEFPEQNKYSGIKFDSSQQKYIPSITYNKKRYSLGKYDTIEDAARTLRAARSNRKNFLEWYYVQFPEKKLKGE